MKHASVPLIRAPFPGWPFLSTTYVLVGILVLISSVHTSAQTTWTGDADNDWSNASNWSAGVPGAADDAVFGSPVPGTGPVILLGAGSLAGQLWLQDNYHFTSGDLTLSSGGIQVNLGATLTLDSLLSGGAGVVKTGGGIVRLTNNANDFTGSIAIHDGTLMISNAAQLGTDTSTIVITESNPLVGNNEVIGFYGGALYLDGRGGPVNLVRDLSIQGSGPVADRSGALLSFGDNELSGVVRLADGLNQPANHPRNTRVISNQGTLTFSNELHVGGTPGTHISSLGGVNTVGSGGNFLINGELSGTGTLNKQGAGTLFLEPSLTENFSGRLRISGNAAAGQSSVRVTSAIDSFGNSVFGTANGANNAAPIDLNTGVLELRLNNSVNFDKNFYSRAGGTIFAGPAPGGDAVGETMSFGAFRMEQSGTATVFNSRNGFGVSFGAWTQQSSNGANTITNQSGGTLVFNGNAWNNSDGSARVLTIGGNGNTLITGGINTSGAGVKTLTKTGAGSLTIEGVNTSLNGPININGGAIVITDFRSLNNNSGTINIGTGATAGALIIGTSVTPSIAGLTTSKVINLAGTTAAVSIYANQSGANPVILNASFNATGGSASQAKTVFLGGANTADNIIHGVIPNNNAGGLVNVTKIGEGTWVLAAANTYTGLTSVNNGTLKLLANAEISTVLPSTNNVTFNQSNSRAGSTLEFVGQDLVNNVQTLGTLTTSHGANTLRLTPGTGGTASMVFDNLATSAVSTLNIVGADFTSNTITFNNINGGPGSDGLISRTIYLNGADYAYRESGVVRAPVYGSDTNFAIAGTSLAAGNNLINADITGQPTHSAVTLKFDGSRNLTLDTGATLTLTGAGILATGGASSISGGTALATAAQALVIRVNQDTDSLAIDSVITGTGGLTKAGEGTLILTAANTRTGTTTILEGTVQLSGSGRLGNAAGLNIRHLGTYDLNGVTSSTNINAFNNAGRVINSSATAATLTIGGGNGTGTSFGVIDETSGVIHVTKIGSGAHSWLGLNTYTGVTTIGSTGLVTVDVLANIGDPSGIGRGDAASAATNAASLVFNGTTGGLVYAGNIRDGDLILGSRSASTDRLFTLSGGGATLSSTATNNNAIVWSNYGDIIHGTVAARTLILDGSSLGDNTFNPRLTDSGTGANITSLIKSGAGQWNLGNPANTYTGATWIENGVLALNHNGALPANSPLVLGQGTTAGVLQMSGVFERDLAATATAGTGTITWSGSSGGGFAAHTGPLIVSIGGLATPASLTWGAGGFVADGASLVFGGTVVNSGANTASALSHVDFRNPIDLGSTQRTINVFDNLNTGADFAIMSGALSGAGGGILKIGPGNLILTGDNTYTGVTAVEAGTLSVLSLGHSSDAASTPTSVGVSGVAFDNSNAITLGNGVAGVGLLQYIGPGEVTDRKIRLNTTTGSIQIHADGTGALVLENLANDMVGGNKTLFLRGTSTAANTIASQLSDNGGTFGITVDGGAVWILTNPDNDYTGLTTAGGGALGLGHNDALGGSELRLSNGSVFAFGGDRLITNAVSQATNTRGAFIGDHSLTFTSPYQLLLTTSTVMSTANNMLGDAVLTFAGGVTANELGNATRIWTFEGGGTTIISDTFTTTTSFGIVLRKTGSGLLELGGDYSSLPGGTFAFNQDGRNVEVIGGVLRAGANNVIPAFSGHGGLLLGSTEESGATATFDLNGTSQTINSLTATTNGTVIIDNTSASPATFRFGANNSTVSFGAGVGDYTIQNSGGGPLSIVKLGNTSATFISGLTLDHSGITASEGGGSFTIASPLNATSGLRAIEDATLALTGGLTNPHLITSIEVGGGSTLSLLDGAGSGIVNLTSLSLGNTGSGTATLSLNLGDLNTPGDFLNTDSLTLLAGGTLNLGNTITFNLTDTGLSPNTTYTLLNVPDGGLAAFGIGNFIQGNAVGGFVSTTWFVDDNVVQFSTGDLILGDLYWRGLTNNTWNANANNWSENKDGTGVPASIPGQGNTVIFAWDNPGAGPLTTTLEQNFRVNNLVFEAGADSTPSAVTIAPGTDPAARLEIRPQDSQDGIEMKSGGPAAVTLSANLRIGSDQTWNVASASSTLTLSGALNGEANVTKTGDGLLILSGTAAPTFNASQTKVLNVNEGTLELQNLAALGTLANSNVAAINVNGGVFYYNNTTATTAAAPVINPVTLHNGTLSLGGNNHFIGPAVEVTAASTINLRDSNSATLTATARNLTLSNGLTGTGNLTLDSTDNGSAANQIAGTLFLNHDNSAWTGDWTILRGTISTNNPNGLGGGSSILAENGRIILAAGSGSPVISHDLTIARTSGHAIFELQTAANIDATLTGLVTLGGSGGTGEFRAFMNNDAATITLAGGVILANDGLIGTQTAATRVLHIDSVISETGGARNLRINDGTWGGTAGTVRLTADNTFSGDITVARGILEFTTVSDVGGDPSSLGQGGAITLGAQAASTLRFIGDGAANSQSTDRPITVTPDATTNFAGILDARGTNGATITYTGPITTTPNVSGSWLVLTGLTGSEGFITGGLTQPGTTADVNVTGGSWTLSGSSFLVADDLFVQNPGTVLTLGSTGILTWGASADNYLDIRNGATLRLDANEAIASGIERIYLSQAVGGAVTTLDTNGFSVTTPRLYVGWFQDNREGDVIGSGTVNVTEQTEAGGIVLYRGSISANLAGPAPMYKGGYGTVILSGNNSGLTASGTTATDNTRVDAGTLILDYTSDNNTKLASAARLDLRGGQLILNGNNSAATSQSVNGLTLAGVGAARIEVNAGTGQTAVFNLGDIIRGASNGTLRLTLPEGAQTLSNGITTTRAANTTTGLLGSSTANSAAFATVTDSTGTWWAGRVSGTGARNIIPLISTASNDVAAWLNDTHITDEVGGFSGSLSSARLHSLRFDATAGSSVNVNATGVLSVISGGILVTDQVTSGIPGILGGTLVAGGATTATGPAELVFITDSSQTFLVSADITRNTAITKAGEGTLRLQSAYNNQTGIVRLQQGALELAGGNALGDTTRVLLSTFDFSTLRLLANETIGSLEGGSNADGLRDIAVTDIGSHTLTINQITGGNRTYAGQLTGTGTIIKEGSGPNTNQNFTNISTDFTGSVIVNGGLFQLSSIGQIDASSFTINRQGMLLIDNNGTTSSTTRILDTTPVILNSAAGADATTIRGLWVRNTDNNSSRFETIGNLVFNSGASYLTGEANVGTGNARAGIIAQDFVRNDNATFAVRGRNLGTTLTHHNQFRIIAANEAAFISSALVGGGGAAATATISILPWAIGATHNATTTGANVQGNSLVTYVTGTGLRPLDLSTEYSTYATAGATRNIRESLTTDLTGLNGRTLNALVIHNNNTAASTIHVTGSGSGQSLTNTSGAFLFTLNPAATASSAHNVILGGFDDGLLAPNGEYIFHVVNPSAAATTATLTVRLDSPLSSNADITKSGLGTLILTAANTAGGGAGKTTLNEGVLEIGALSHIGGGTGALVFAGGTLRLATGFIDDVSDRVITFLPGGGSIDTNGNDLALSSSLGTGLGGFTKEGAGILTLNAAATYAGTTVVAGGTLAIGADNATGVGGDLTILGGATLDTGTSAITAGLVTTSGASPQITGTGAINASTGFLLNHTGDTTISAAFGGSGALLKLQSNVVTLTGASTYTGRTEVHNGGLVFDSIGNVGGGPSALGNPLNAQEGIIRMGLTTEATSLTYIGSGHGSDRLIGIQGTTGAATLHANGTGAVAYGGVIGLTPNNNTLTLRGTSDPALINQIGGIDQGVINTLTLIKTDANTWEINGPGTYSGLTDVDGGTLRISHSQALGTSDGGVIIRGNAKNPVLELAGGITVTDKTLTLEARQLATIFDTHLRNLNGQNEWSGDILFSTGGSTYTIESAAGHLTLSGTITGATTTGTRNLRFIGASDGLVSGPIVNGSATVAVFKEGDGVWTFSGTNTYSGPTTVNAGTLIINGDNSGATGSVIVAAGATLGGTGIIGGATSIEGIHSPGNSPGLQTFNAGLEYSGSNPSFLWELYSSTADPLHRGNETLGWDGVDITGGDLNFISPTTMSLVFNGTDGLGSSVLWSDALWLSDQQWLVYQLTGSGSILNFDNFSIFTTDWLDSAGNAFSLYGGEASNFFLTQSGNNIFLNYTAIPEPGRALLLLIGALGIVCRRRR